MRLGSRFTEEQVANLPQGFQHWVHSDAAAALMVAWWKEGNITGFRAVDLDMGRWLD
jgi:hypothetical protein